VNNDNNWGHDPYIPEKKVWMGAIFKLLMYLYGDVKKPP
jgi:hypothetical protein